MRQLAIITSIIIPLLGCQPSDCANSIQDGNETGIDCGGDCDPCIEESLEINKLSQSPTYILMQGNWHRELYFFLLPDTEPRKGGGEITKGTISFEAKQIKFTTQNATAKTIPDMSNEAKMGDLTNIIESTMLGSYHMSLTQNEDYPNPNKYTFNTHLNKLDDWIDVECNSNQLKLERMSPNHLEYSLWTKTKAPVSQKRHLQFEFTTSNFTRENTLEIHLLFNNVPVDTILIEPNKTFYSMDWLAEGTNEYKAILVNKDSGNIENMQFKLDAKLLLGELELSWSNMNQSICILGNGTIPKDCYDNYLAPAQKLLLLQLNATE